MNHDQPTRDIASFARSLRYEDLDSSVIAAGLRYHLDAMAGALGGFSTEQSSIARRVASVAKSSYGCTLIGVLDSVAPEQATFANATMIATSSTEDSGPDEGHRGELVAAIFAAAELSGASGKEVVRAICIGNSIFMALVESYPTREKGLDSSFFIGICAAMAAGSIFGLDQDGLENAVAIAVVSSMAMLSTSGGVLPNWKNSAGAHGAMTGLFSARIAREGMTGPESPFTGEDGLHQWVLPRHEAVLGPHDARPDLLAKRAFSPSHWQSQANDQELHARFRRLADGVLDEAAAVDLEGLLWDLAGLNDVSALSQHFQAIR